MILVKQLDDRLHRLVAGRANIGEQNLLLDCDVTQQSLAKLGIRGSLYAMWIRARARQQRVEPLMVVGQSFADST